MVPPNDSNHPSPSLFWSLPKEIVLNVLARISTSYYPMLSLVSKQFRSLILSEELRKERSYHGIREECVYVCLQAITNPCEHIWFSLWIKPNDHHQPLTHWTEYKSTGNLLLPMPSSYTPRLPIFHTIVGSETYEIGGENTPFSTDVWVYDKLIDKRSKAPSMTLARKNAFTCSADGKLYVMGGSEEFFVDEPTWAEIFDPKTQTWEALPNPYTDLRFSLIEKIEAHRGNIYVRSNRRNFVYLTKQDRWEIMEEEYANSMCEIENVWYCCENGKFFWYDDTKYQAWRYVKGLSRIDRNFMDETEICSYGGKLAIVWIGAPKYSLMEDPEIWCAVVLLEKCKNGEIWGHIEWADVVLVVPHTFTLLRCMSFSQ